MKELFLPDGHLSEDALAALLDGSLDEFQRLEVGEHLSYCDRCVDRYTALLTGEALETVPRDQTAPVMWRLEKKKWKSTLRRYASAAAAVVIGSMLWYTGALEAVGKTLYQPPEIIEQQISREPSRSQNILEAVHNWSARVRDAAAPGFRPPQQIQQNPINESEEQSQ